MIHIIESYYRASHWTTFYMKSQEKANKQLKNKCFMIHDAHVENEVISNNQNSEKFIFDYPYVASYAFGNRLWIHLKCH